MKTMIQTNNAPSATLAKAVAACLLGAVTVGAQSAVAGGPCTKAAEAVRVACGYDVKDDYWTGKAKCINVSDTAERRECFADLGEEMDEGVEECNAQLGARLSLCKAVGQDRYDPDFSPEHFVDPRDIGSTVTPNMYFPLVEGTQWVYRADFQDEDGNDVTEVITVVVTDEVKLIDGVLCRTVNDLVEVDTGDGPRPLEDTNDWYAQDLSGNVWYCGEEVKDYEVFEGDQPMLPELVAIDGSFKVGRDGAKPGITMFAAPEVGATYRQESAFGDAEDFATINSLTASESVPAASCDGDCLVTTEGNLLDPGVYADKYYAPGVGNILEVEGDVRVELISFTPGGGAE